MSAYVTFNERVCVVTTRDFNTGSASTLHCYDNEDLQHHRSYGLGRWTTSSPKIWWGKTSPYVFLFGSGDPSSKLYVIQEGRFITSADVCGNVVIGGREVKAQAGLPLLPTAAVIDNPLFTPAGEPTLVIADHCGVAAFRFTNERLNKLWQTTFDNDQDNVTSPAVSGDVIAVGRADGRLIVYSFSNGSEQFHYDAGEPILASPSIFGLEILIVSLHALHVVDFNGNLLRKAALPGMAIASPAVSLDGIYVSTDGGFASYSWDFSKQSVDKALQGQGSSPAIMREFDNLASPNSIGILLATADGNLRYLVPPPQ